MFLKHQSLGALQQELPILTETGYRPIEELKIGDMVYTKNGSLQPIENTMSHIADNIVSTQVSGALSLKNNRES